MLVKTCHIGHHTSWPILSQQKGFSEKGLLQLKIDVLECKSMAKIASYGNSDSNKYLCKAVSASDKFSSNIKNAEASQKNLLKYKESIGKIYAAIALGASYSYSPVFLTENAFPRIYAYKNGVESLIFPPLIHVGCSTFAKLLSSGKRTGGRRHCQPGSRIGKIHCRWRCHAAVFTVSPASDIADQRNGDSIKRDPDPFLCVGPEKYRTGFFH